MRRLARTSEGTARPGGPSHAAGDTGDLEITGLLKSWKQGEPEAEEQCFDRIYPHLDRIATGVLARERRSFVLESKELLHEAYLRLVRHRLGWQNRSHFFATVAQLMRRIVIDRAKHSQRHKRGAGIAHLSLDDIEVATSSLDFDRFALQQAMAELASIDAIAARVATLRYIEGMSLEEVAETLKIGRATVVRSWKSGRIFLSRYLSKASAEAWSSRES